MTNSIQISAFIIAKNEEKRIGSAIKSLKSIATEIIVIDSGSTDRTCEIAESHGARVIFNAWPGYGMQKRFGEDQCHHDWLLNIDADERLSRELVAEIEALRLGEVADGYRFLIRDRFPFEVEPAPWAHTYDPVRLYNRRKGRYSDHDVHDRVDMYPDTRVTALKSVVYHDSMHSLDHLVAKMNRYSSLQAQTLRKDGRKLGILRLFFEFPIAFLKVYFGRLYFRYGRWGFILSMTYAFGRFTRLSKRHEMDLMDNPEIRPTAQTNPNG